MVDLEMVLISLIPHDRQSLEIVDAREKKQTNRIKSASEELIMGSCIWLMFHLRQLRAC